MKLVAISTTMICLALSLNAAAQSPTPKPAPIDPETLVWITPPNNPAARATWALGQEQKAGPYILRVRLSKGGRIMPHTHPDERNSTVLSGTLYVGFGETFDEARLVAVPTGSIYVAPANVPHFVWAKDDDVIYQEAGVGPTGSIPAKP